MCALTSGSTGCFCQKLRKAGHRVTGGLPEGAQQQLVVEGQRNGLRRMWYLAPPNPRQCSPKHGCGAHLRVTCCSDNGLSALIKKAYNGTTLPSKAEHKRKLLYVCLIANAWDDMSIATNYDPLRAVMQRKPSTIPLLTGPIMQEVSIPQKCDTDADVSPSTGKAACIFKKPTQCQPQGLLYKRRKEKA